MCGLPRSGKTTYVKEHFQDYVRVSMDDIVASTTQTFNMKFGAFYTKIENLMIKELVKKGANFVIDRTSLTKKSRLRTKNKILKAAIQAGRKRPVLKLVVISTNMEICITRNIKTQKVPKGVFINMARSFECPDIDEGWDEIIYT